MIDPSDRLIPAVARHISGDVATGVGFALTPQEMQQGAAQQLESVGQLAAGVAHDLNNLLGVIVNYAAFVAHALAANPKLADDVEEIRKAAEQAAALARQLVVLGRRDATAREVLCLNGVIGDVDELLRRALGDHIELSSKLAENLWNVSTDSGQIERVLLNLAVNARYAMPRGGAVTIATRNITVDREVATANRDLAAGKYVELAVTDTGCGMSDRVTTRALEPFFTTKPKGKGTGLGLATIDGIAHRHSGRATVSSKRGHGTTVRVMLAATTEPRSHGTGDTAIAAKLRPGEPTMTRTKVHKLLHSEDGQ